MRLIVFALVLSLSVVAKIRAATLNALTSSVLDVTAAVTQAVAGDTVTLPAGDYTWSGTLTISKAIHLQGAGVGKTIIRYSGGSLLIWASNIPASVDGIEFHLTAATNSADILYLRGRNNKISNCLFVGETSKVCGVRAVGGTSNPHPTGVVWNCSFVSARALVQGDIASSTTQGFGRRIWADLDDTVAFGSSNTMFFEDCSFDLSTNTGNVIDAEYGGHYVFRHNRVLNGGVFVHGITSNSERGTRLVEVYDNSFSSVAGKTPQDPAVRLRGGTAVAFNNVITGTWNAAMMLDGELTRYGNDVGDGNLAVPNGSGTHNGGSGATTLTDTTKNWVSNAYVGWTLYNITDGSSGTITANTSSTVTATLANGTRNSWTNSDTYKITNGYPLRDQIGRGKDATFWTWGAPGPSQANEPVYEWNNTFNGADANFTVPPAYQIWIQLGRDFYQNTARPGYTPYTYPHPLRSGTSLTLPAPSNVRVNTN